jgi:hypothetical protein
MPQNAAKKPSNDEGRLLLAMNALKKGQITSMREAARVYCVPRSTLHARMQGRAHHSYKRPKNTKLSETEEITLRNWILSMDKRGCPVRPSMVEQMANCLLAKRDSIIPPPIVGKCWVNNYLKRQQDLQTRYIRKYNYERALCEDPTIIGGFFDDLERVFTEYGIAEEDVWNFDETGFAMGIISTAKVVCSSDRKGKPRLLQPGNREWVTAVECISARGIAVPSLIILKSVNKLLDWYNLPSLPPNWAITESPNGWTSDELGLEWLQKIFDPWTKPYTVGRYRLLILDGHSSHLTPLFDQHCAANDIITVCMPPHSSHLLQPLDVGVFAVLKRLYGHAVENRMRCGVNHIDKDDFLTMYADIRDKAYTIQNIKSGFLSTGISPFDRERVLSKLDIQLRTPTPPSTSHSSANWSPKTPNNIKNLIRQTNTINRLINQRLDHPNSPTKRALDQLIKGCSLAMNSATILAQENQELRAANHHQKQKRTTRGRPIDRQGILTVSEGREIAAAALTAQEALQLPNPEVASGARRRAPRTCSNCKQIGHVRTYCPNNST